MDYNLIKWPTMSEKPYPGLFRSLTGYPIIFYFHLDDIQVKKKFEELVKTYGGNYVEKYTDMNAYTAFMVDDKCVRNFYNRVCFKASYVLKCVNDGNLYDINSFIHNDVAKFKVDDYMRVIFLRESTFTGDHVSVTEQNLPSCSTASDKVSKTVINQKVSAYRIELEESNSNKDKNCKSSKLEKDCAQNSKSKSMNEASEKTLKKCLNPCEHCVFHMEKEEIDNIIGSRNERERCNSSRSKEFCNNGASSSSNPIKLVSECNSRKELNRDSSPLNSREYPKLPIETSKSRKEVDEHGSSDSELSLKRNKCNKKRQICSDSDNDSLEFPPSPKSTRPLPNNNRNRNKSPQIFSEEEDDEGFPNQSNFSRTVDMKHSRSLYSRVEKEAILQYIVKKDAYHNVTGNSFWKKMERSNICPKRTWMSLQNHFKKTLLKELEMFPFLTKYQINMLRGK